MQLHRLYWCSQASAKGVLHIAHGMAEHAARYQHVAERLTGAGWHVYAGDHRGHGRSVRSDDDLGWFAEVDGWNLVVDDLRRMIETEKSAHPDLPLVVLGHSMGSLVVRRYLQQHSHDVAAAVLSAPFGERNFLFHLGRFIARGESLRQGKRGRSALINGLSFADFNKPFAPNRTEFDWLSRDEKEVDKYVADPACGFFCTNQLWLDLLAGLGETLQPGVITQYRHDLPVLVLCGSRDPVGKNGTHAKALTEAMKQAGLTRVTLKIYADARHECFNESNRDEVLADLLKWCEAILA